MFSQAGIAALVNLYVAQFNENGERGNMMFVYEPPIPLPIPSPWYLFGFALVFLVVWYGTKKLLELKRLDY